MGAALALPLIARKLIEIASIEQATAIAHGCTGMDQERMDASIGALEPDIRVIAAGCADVAQRTHANLWGRAYIAKTPQAPAPDTPACVEIAFERGVPVAINGVPMPLTELIESLSIIAGQHGVGWIEEERDVTGSPTERVHEAPAAVVLHAARAALDTLVLPRDLLRLKRDRAIEYARLVSKGLWFTAGRETMDAVNAKVQENMSGSVVVKLFKGTLLRSEAARLEHASVSRT